MRQKRLSPKKVGNAIYKYRELNQFSVLQFASLIGVCTKTLFNWEKGKNLPILENVSKICNIFNIEVNSLILYED